MKEWAIRLRKGTDLKAGIEAFARENNLDLAVVLSAVGCLSAARFRLAEARDEFTSAAAYEILSLNGTIAKGDSHLHIGVADSEGRTYGGHLLYGSTVNTTVELVLGELESYRGSREFDQTTGYRELVIEKKDK